MKRIFIGLVVAALMSRADTVLYDGEHVLR